MLYRLADGLARTSTELAAVADVSPSTASVHLQRLLVHQLVNVVAQARHRYYTLSGPEVSSVLEARSVGRWCLARWVRAEYPTSPARSANLLRPPSLAHWASRSTIGWWR